MCQNPNSPENAVHTMIGCTTISTRAQSGRGPDAADAFAHWRRKRPQECENGPAASGLLFIELRRVLSYRKGETAPLRTD